MQLVAINERSFILLDVSFVSRIRKNLLLAFALAKNGLVVKFVDDMCTTHDLNDGENIVASSSICHGLYGLDVYKKCVNNVACTDFNM